MDICIVGAGPSGVYTSYLLSKTHNVQVFDRKNKDELWNACAWSIGLRELKYYCNVLDLKPGDYVLHRGEEIISDVFHNKDSITFHKKEFFSDVMDMSQASFSLSTKVDRGSISGYDLVVDATGRRSIIGNGSDDIVVPCYQLEVKSEDLPDDIYVDLYSEGGYLWSFPLGAEVYRVGAGLIGVNPQREVRDFLSRKNYEVVENCSGKVRLSSPSHSSLYKNVDGTNIVAVGESAGTVCPLNGEGTAPSMRSAEILSKTIGNEMWYRQRMREEFDWIAGQYEFIKSVAEGNVLSKMYRLITMKVPDHLPGSVSKFKMFLRG